MVTGDGQLDRHYGPFVDNGVDGETTAVIIDYPLNNRKTEPTPSSGRVPAPDKLVSDLHNLVLRNSPSLITDPYRQCLLLLDGNDLDRGALTGITNRVVDEIIEQEFHGYPIRMNRRQPVRHVELQRHVHSRQL